jgi:penicillin amidase
MRILVRIVLFLGGLVAALMLIGAGFWLWAFWGTKPDTSGQVRVTGLTGEVTIVRDEHGVPHIFGETEADVFFGLGYAHAQDRFFQMDMMRRYVQGRLSEAIGERAVRVDARNRIRGYPNVAAAAVANMDAETLAAAEAYTAGVNARLARGTPSPEYRILMFNPATWMFRPEEWRLVDTASVVVYMADSLAAGEDSEMSRRRLEDILMPDQMAEFLPEYPEWAPTMLQAEDYADRAAVPADNGLPADEVQPDVDEGSNAWVLSGDHTASGEPLLANDPHLSLSAPGIWYFARLALPDGNVVGATVAGAPLVVLGRNDVSAWGFTNTGFDVIDLQEFERGELEIVERTETIAVRGGDPVELTIRQSPIGPVLDPEYFAIDAYGDVDVVLQSTALDMSNDVAGVAYRIMKSRNWEEFVEAGRGYTAPMQNMHYAHIDGTIGYTTAGLVPLRDENGRWTGYIPYDELPRVRNPESGRVASGNNRITPENYGYPMPGEYAIFRAVRINEQLDLTARHDAESYHTLQMDVLSAQAARLIPAIAASEPQTPDGQRARDLLAAWDGSMPVYSNEALIYALWYRAFARALYGDELGEDFPRFIGRREGLVDNVLVGGETRWCDDVTTPAAESCAVTVGAALDAAMETGIAQFGPDIDNWSWGSAHAAVFDHPVFTGMPVLDGMFTVRQPVGGDGSTVNVAVYPMRGDSFDVFHGPSLRAIYDMSDLDASRYMHAPGQSGHPWSGHYRDLAPMWAAGESFEMRTDWTPETAPEGSDTLVLRPRD